MPCASPYVPLVTSHTFPESEWKSYQDIFHAWSIKEVRYLLEHGMELADAFGLHINQVGGFETGQFYDKVWLWDFRTEEFLWVQIAIPHLTKTDHHYNDAPMPCASPYTPLNTYHTFTDADWERERPCLLYWTINEVRYLLQLGWDQGEVWEAYVVYWLWDDNRIPYDSGALYTEVLTVRSRERMFIEAEERRNRDRAATESAGPSNDQILGS